MQRNDQQSTSVWMATADLPLYPALDGDASAEVCIVGAGIAGLSAAYELALEGKKVIVLDDGPVGGGETGRTTAHITHALDDRYYNIEKQHGELGMKLAADSHTAAIERIVEIVGREQIECNLRRLDGVLFIGGHNLPRDIEREFDAAQRAGLSKVTLEPNVTIGTFDTGPALRFPDQAQFHPLRYLQGLAEAIVRMGGRIHTNTHVNEISGGNVPSVKTSSKHTVTAQSVIVATNTPVNDWVVLHTKQAAYRTYVVGFAVPAGSIPLGLYWDTPDPYHYIRLMHGYSADEAERDILIVGGEDHKTGQADDAGKRFACIEEWTRERFPMAGPIEYQWSGQIMEPIDHLAFIGRDPGGAQNVFIATGDSGNGITHGAIAGMLLRDLIVGRENAWSSLYDPARIPLRATGQFLKENLNVARQYADLVTPGQVEHVADIPPGEAAVLRLGKTKVAAYRDEGGSVHLRSAICTHLYCVVGWNHEEKTWDCPCHGSRFTADGKVVNGPAISDLKTLSAEDEKAILEGETAARTPRAAESGSDAQA